MGQGRNLVLLHSLLSDRTAFDRIAPRLAAERRVWLVNLPGFGASAPAGPGPRADVADRIAEQLPKLGLSGKADLLGNGFGGFVSVALAVRHGALFDRLVLVDTGAAIPPEGKGAFHAMAERVEDGGMEAVLATALHRMFPDDFLAAHPAIAEERKASLRAAKPEHFAAACRALARFDRRAELASIRNPRWSWSACATRRRRLPSPTSSPPAFPAPRWSSCRIADTRRTSRIPKASGRRSSPSCNSPDSAAAMPHWFFASLRGYRMGWLPSDLVAGLMLAAIAIPGQLATARLAGMPPQTGLYAFAAGSLAFAAFGANRFMSVAADSTIAPIFAGGLASIAVAGSANYAQLATLLALMVGIILVAVGLFRAGWLATLLSIPVTTGFLAGISIHIIIGELPTLLGVSEEQGHILRAARPHRRPSRRRPISTRSRSASACWPSPSSRREISPRVPGALIGLVAAGLAVALFHLDARGVSVLGALPAALPTSPCRPCPISMHWAAWCSWPWWSPWSASCRRQPWRAHSRPTTESPTM